MPGAAELPEEFADPVAYSLPWLWIAIGLLAVVVAYYLLAWWLTRAPRPERDDSEPLDVPSVRTAHLRRIDEVEERVRSGALSAREGHQQLSELVRSYVQEVSPLPARSMALADFRHRAPAPLVGAIELMYPPEFGPEQAMADETFPQALASARSVIGSWG